MVRVHAHPIVIRTHGVDRLGRDPTEHLGVSEHGIVVVGRGGAEIHGQVLSLAGGRVNVGVSGIRGNSDPCTDVTVSQMVLEGGVGDVVIGGRVGGGDELCGCERVGGGVGRDAGVIWVEARGVEGGTIEILGGRRDESRGSQDGALGRLRPGVGRVGGGGGDGVGPRVSVCVGVVVGEKVEGAVCWQHMQIDGGHVRERRGDGAI